MAGATFRTKELVTGQKDKLSAMMPLKYYPTEEPSVPVAGDWRERFCTLQKSFSAILDRVHNFEVREDDVWIVTYPKCGTTWMQELAWLITNDYDFAQAKEIDISKRSPFIEFNGIVPNLTVDTIEEINNLPSPRVIKSHLPIWLIPKQIWTKKAKIIYVFRNPKDVAVSMFHHVRGMVGYKDTKENLFQSIIDDTLVISPFWMHVLDFWKVRNESNVFFTSFERMKLNLEPVIRELCVFLNKNLDENILPELIDHLSFDKMKDNVAVSHAQDLENIKKVSGHDAFGFKFMRRGEVNSHKDEMSAESIEMFDAWTKQNLKPYNVEINDIIKFSKN